MAAAEGNDGGASPAPPSISQTHVTSTATTANEEGLAEMPEEVETKEERKKREKEEAKAKLQEFGGAVSLRKLVSMATWGELAVLWVGVFGALVHGASQPVLCLFFGNLIDALAVDPASFGAMGVNGTAMNVTAPSAASASMGMSADGFQDFMDQINSITIQFCYVGVIVCAVGAMQGSLFVWFAEKQVRKMRTVYLDAALYRDVSWYDTHDAGGLATEMNSDLEIYADGFGNKLGASFMSIGGVIVGFGIGIYLEWKVGLLMCVSVPVLGVGGALMGEAFLEIQNETQSVYGRAANIVNEVLYSIRTVVAFGGEKREIARYDTEIEKARKGGVRMFTKIGLGQGYIWMAYFSSLALAFWFGMKLVYDGANIKVGDLLASFFCVLTAGFTIGQVPPGFAALLAAKSAMARFFYIKDHESEIQKRLRDERREMGPIESMQLQDVQFAYPARPLANVLNGLTLSIKKGQKVAVVGESGSGKSTVMALLERFYDPTQGQVLINGEDLKLFSVSSYRKQIGYVGQEPVLFTTTVKENILQGNKTATDEDLKRVFKMAQLSFINNLPEQLNTFVGSGGNQFSGGQKQRIAIARALLKNPSVLFLDEATSALDSKSEREIQKTIDDIGSQTQGGLTMVSIAHRLSTVVNSDVIYVLQSGQVAEFGTHQELTAKPDGLYRALAAAQNLANNDQSKEAAEGELNRQVSGDVKKETSDAKKEASGKGAKQPEEDDDEKRAKQIEKTYKVPMGRLLTFCKPEAPLIVFGVLAAMVSGAVFPIIGGYTLTDSMGAFLQPDREVMKREIEMTAIWFCIWGAIKWVATVVQYLSFGIIGEAITKRCRIAMLTAMFRMEIGFHDDPENTPGKLEKALQSYAYRVKAVMTVWGEQSDAMCSIIVGITIAFISSWEMTLAMLVSIPLFGVAQMIQMTVVMGAAKDQGEKQKKAQQVVSDSVMNMKTVQASGCEKNLLALYQAMLPEPTAMQDLKYFCTTGLTFGLSSSIIFWVLAGGMWFMGFLIEEGRTTFITGQRAFMGILYAGLGAGMAMSMAGKVGAGKVAAHDMFLLLDRKSKINGLEPEGVIPESNMQIGRFEFKDVRFFYPFRPDVEVLKGMSFVIEAGQSVGVVGPSGGGKSTVMAMIQRFYDPQSGSVMIGQERIALNSVNIRWWRKKVGFVGQEPILFDDTVLANVKYGLDEGEEVSEEHLSKCKEMANLNFLDRGNAQGWETIVGARGGRLSGGQKQRVAICRALVRNPPVLLLDEATSALDTKSEKVVQAALENARKGRTSFAIAHRLSTVQDCDVIIVVSEGRIVEQGTHSQLLSQGGVYYKLTTQAASKDKK